MRLLDNTPLKNLIYHYGLSQPTIGVIRSYLASFQNLKVAEQKLNFMRKCKALHVVPKFVCDCVNINWNLVRQSSYVDQLVSNMRSVVLNQCIRETYGDISHWKRQLCNLKHQLYLTLPNQFILHGILQVSDQYSTWVKSDTKTRLQDKLLNLVNLTYPQNVQHPKPNPLDRVTVLDIDPDNPINLTPGEINVLAYGPQFAVAPKINKSLIEQTKTNIAHCAYRLRWSDLLNDPANPTTDPNTNLYPNTDLTPPFNKPYAAPPPNNNPILEQKLSLLGNFITRTLECQKDNISCNLSVSEQESLTLLKARENLHVSVSDKCGEFVVTNLKTYKDTTINHIKTTSGAYEFVRPTRVVDGVTLPTKKPTETTYRNQLKSMRNLLESQCNKVWSDMCERRGITEKNKKSLLTHHSTLPTMYTLLKTHKVPPDIDLTTLDPHDLKVRPIVSCSGSPTEKLAWLITNIIKPLLHHIPTHLFNIHTHLDILASIHPDELKSLHFYSADISALYTNLTVPGCIDNVLQLAEEHWTDLPTFTLTLDDLKLLLETVFCNSYFTFNHRLFRQIIGLFMGCRPSAILAVIRVYHFEKSSIFTDITFISHPVSLFYKRYMDDMASLARTKDEATMVTDSIASQDPDNNIVWEIDFREMGEGVPFLDTKLTITKDGRLSSTYYRKPQDKGITLHYRSHHPTATKSSTAKNFYKTAVDVSTGPNELQVSLTTVDKLLTDNDYQNPRQYAHPNTKKKRPPQPQTYQAPLIIPYTNDHTSNKIRNYIKSLKLPIRPIFTPGNTLRATLCSSRPLDKKVCEMGNPQICKICPIMENSSCSAQGIVYKATCMLCPDKPSYIGESGRPAHARFSEHIRAAKTPTSYPDNALAKHYKTAHSKSQPNIIFKVMARERNTTKRKILEARKISEQKPILNNREELCDVLKFLIL